MYVVNTRVAENGRRLVKIREFVGRVVSHGVVPDSPGDFSSEKLLAEKNAYVEARGGTVRQPVNQNLLVNDIHSEHDGEEEELRPKNEPDHA
jgi:hypothetical protein